MIIVGDTHNTGLREFRRRSLAMEVSMGGLEMCILSLLFDRDFLGERSLL
jgi:hypothetical protein